MPRKTLIYILSLLTAMLVTSCSQPEQEQSNKAERNAIKKGNKLYGDKEFDAAAEAYSQALAANSDSRAAKYNHALSILMSGTNDSSKLAQARLDLVEIAKQHVDPRLSEKAIYNLANDAVYLGDALMAMVDSAQQSDAPLNFGMGITMPQGNAELDSIRQIAIKSYHQAIDNYKYILRKSPGNYKALQNLRITQLKLPPDQSGGGGNNNQQQDQNQQQQQQNQQQQDQQQQAPQDRNDQQTLNAVQMKENESRKEQKPNAVGRRSSDKPW